jgi:hypothetical protein
MPLRIPKGKPKEWSFLSFFSRTHRPVADLTLNVELEAGGALEVEDLALDAEVVLTALLLPYTHHTPRPKPIKNQ